MKTCSHLFATLLCLPLATISAAVSIDWNSTGALNPGESTVDNTGATV